MALEHDAAPASALAADLVVPPDTPAGRYILTADVSINGRPLGAWVEALAAIGGA